MNYFPALLAQADRAVLSLGGPVTYETSVGEVIEVAKAMFSVPYLMAEAGSAGVSSSAPVVDLRLSDLVTAEGRVVDPEDDAVGARVVHDGTRYRVRSVQKDGMGWVRLLLHEEG